MAEETVVYECQTCWVRAATAEGIEHQAVIRHPLAITIRRLVFPVVEAPSPGMFGGLAGVDRASETCTDREV